MRINAWKGNIDIKKASQKINLARLFVYFRLNMNFLNERIFTIATQCFKQKL